MSKEEEREDQEGRRIAPSQLMSLPLTLPPPPPTSATAGIPTHTPTMGIPALPAAGPLTLPPQALLLAAALPLELVLRLPCCCCCCTDGLLCVKDT